MARVEQPGDRHAAPARLALVQDLVNTVDFEGGVEEFGTPEELTAWVRGRGIEPDADFDADGLARVLELREALREVCAAHAGTDVPAETLETLAGLLAAAPLSLAVDAEGSARVAPAAGLTGVPALTARIAAAVAEAAADGTWQRLKTCHSHTCRWVYYDRSPAGRSRWCTMSLCGSREKMRRYRGSRARRAEAGGDR